MTLEKLTRAQFAAEMGYVNPDGSPSARAVAQILRDALERWGLSPHRDLLKHVRDQLRAGDIEGDITADVTRKLIALGECAEVFVGHERCLAPAERRWLMSGGREAVLLGAGRPPATMQPATNASHDDIVVRVRVASEEDAALLEADGTRQVTLSEWLHPLGHLSHAARRLGAPARGDRLGLAAFWELLSGELVDHGHALGPDADVRVLAGPVGGFFGRHRAAEVEGRWMTDPPAGVWCAYRKGHGEKHWLPALVSVEGEDRRSFDLFDNDEWRWALLARSHAVGPLEVVRRTEKEEVVTWPLPAQLRAAMDMRGRPAGPWRWRVADDAPELWSLLK